MVRRPVPSIPAELLSPHTSKASAADAAATRIFRRDGVICCLSMTDSLVLNLIHTRAQAGNLHGRRFPRGRGIARDIELLLGQPRIDALEKSLAFLLQKLAK